MTSYEEYRNIIRKHSVGVVEFIKKDNTKRVLRFNNEMGKMYLSGGVYSGRNVPTLEPIFEVASDGSPVGWKSVSLDKIISLKI